MKNPKVDAYLKKPRPWQDEIRELREIILDCGLTEELKWGKPCYALEESNVVILIPLKEHCALMFAKGALLKDAKGLLGKPGEHTQAGRWLKFASVREIQARKAIIKAYIREAMAAQRAGLEVRYKETSEFAVPEEFEKALRDSPALNAAFADLTPGRQRGYLIYFSGAKQSKTREARVEKCRPRILAGKGLQDG